MDAEDILNSLIKLVLRFLFSVKGLIISAVLIVGTLVLAFLFAFIVIIAGGSEDCDNKTEGNGLTPGQNIATDQSADKNAKALFDHMVKAEGASGAGAAGVVAVAYRESNLNPQAVNPGGGVAGILQWSGWFNQVNGNRIVSEGSIKNGDMSTLTMENELKLLHFELGGSFSSARKAMANASDPTEAAKEWSQTYEGVALSDGQTKISLIDQYAKKYYQQFGGSSIKGNPALGGANKAAQTGDQNDDANNANKCSTDDGGSGADGYGLPVKGEYTLGTGTYPSYTQGSQSHDHNGVDFQSKGLSENDVRSGTDKAGVYAVHNGTVQQVMHIGDQYVVVIKQTDKRYSYYGHALIQPKVKVGDVVSRGQLITYQGYGGDVRPKSLQAAHVHFGLAKSSAGGFGPDAPNILSPADYLPLPKEVLQDGTSSGPNDRVIGSGFTKVFNAKSTDKESGK
ncbi:phage tail tip lysozyme [Weissella viridescens]|uniref:phage tail tip lysozyme n=1 Tax=Weissella viridescens TaxID=1629 RepID=UPI003AF2E61E